MSARILVGDCLTALRSLPEESVQMCVTSPPYYGLRQYLPPDHADHGLQLGLEPAFDCLGWATQSRCGACYVCRLTAVFAEVRRVLRHDGTLWLNLGDSYAAQRDDQKPRSGSGKQASNAAADFVAAPNRRRQDGLKPKDLMLVPERVALSLQADGWYLRSRIIWHKTAPMPESVRDRPTKSHEHLWLLSKSERYYYSESAREPCTQDERRPTFRGGAYVNGSTFDNGAGGRSTNTGNVRTADGATRNWRDVWPIGPEPFRQAHRATFQTEIPRRAIVAGSKAGDVVLDPFAGAGTTGLVADQLARDSILIELNTEYAEMARDRIRGAAPLYARVELYGATTNDRLRARDRVR